MSITHSGEATSQPEEIETREVLVTGDVLMGWFKEIDGLRIESEEAGDRLEDAEQALYERIGGILRRRLESGKQGLISLSEITPLGGAPTIVKYATAVQAELIAGDKYEERLAKLNGLASRLNSQTLVVESLLNGAVRGAVRVPGVKPGEASTLYRHEPLQSSAGIIDRIDLVARKLWLINPAMPEAPSVEVYVFNHNSQDEFRPLVEFRSLHVNLLLPENEI